MSFLLIARQTDPQVPENTLAFKKSQGLRCN